MVPLYLLYRGTSRECPKCASAKGLRSRDAFADAVTRWDPNRIRDAAGFGIVAVLAAVLVAAAFTGILTPLSVPRGTVFSQADLRTWVVNFDVPASGGRVVGAWTAYNVSFPPYLVVANGSLDSPPIVLCPRFVVSIPELNGTVNRSVTPGPHALFWLSCSHASRIVVTESIILA